MKEWAARLLLIAFGGAVALVGAEAWLRAFAPQPLNVLYMREDNVLLHVANLDIELVSTESRARIRTNAAGLRDVARPVEKPAGITRVLVLGDSMIEGLQVELEETMPKRLEALLRSALPEKHFDVINAGVSGSSGPMAHRFLEKDGLAYDPDLVVVAITTRNDVQEAMVTRVVPRPVGYELRVFLRSRFHLYGLLEKGINASPAIRNALAVLGILSPSLPPPKPNAISGEAYLYDGKLSPFEVLGYERLFKAYDGMMALCEERGVPMLFVILPSYFQATRYAALLGNPGRVGAVVRNARETQDRLLAFMENRGARVIDLLPEARLKPEVYFLPRDQHFTAAGNAFAAELTARAIVDMDLLAQKAAAPSPGE